MWFCKKKDVKSEKKKVLIKLPIVLQKAIINTKLKNGRIIETHIEQKLHKNDNDPNIIDSYSLNNYTYQYQFFMNNPLITFQISDNETLTMRSEEIQEVNIKYEKLRDDFITRYEDKV